MRAFIKSKLFLMIAGFIMIASAIATPFSSPQLAFAASFQLSGKVTSDSDNPIGNTTITVTDPNSQATVGTTATDTNGNYSLSVSQGTYNITVTPPSSSGFQSTTVSNQTISSDTILNFTLVPLPPPPVTLSGHITDRTGAAVSGLTVSGGISQTTTDSSGFYSVQTSSGVGSITVTGGGGSYLPGIFSMRTTVNVSQDITLDIQLPGDLLTVHVQDPSQNPVANASVQLRAISSASFSIQTSLGSLQFTTATDNALAQSTGTTDSSGNVILPMFPVQAQINVSPSTNILVDTSIQQSITQDSTIQVTLASVPGNITVSGHVTDKTGAVVVGVTVGEGGIKTTTDNNGFYSLQLQSGSVGLFINGGSSSTFPSFNIQMANNLNITQDTTLNIQLPSDLITVHVQDQLQNIVANAGVTIKYNLNSSLSVETSLGVVQFGSSTDNSLATSNGQTDNSGNRTLPMFPGLVNISVDPPTNTLLSNSVTQSITQNTSLTVTLDNTPTAKVTVSGHVTDRTGTAIAGVTVSIGGGTATTDNNGFYSLQSLATGEPIIIQSGRGANFPSFNLGSNGVSLTQDTTIDIHLPGNLVAVHVQDTSQNPVANAGVNICSHSNSVIIQTSLGALQFGPNSESQCLVFANGQTNNLGNITLPIFSGTTNIAVDPPSGSNFLSFSTTTTITGDTTQIFALQLPNNPPSINPIANATVNEGNTYSANGSFIDPDSTSWTATVDYGDGSGSQTLALSGTNFSLSHLYKDNGTYTITVNITDNQGATGTGTATVTVNNVAPTVGTITAPSSPVLVNTAITASANFTDAGILDTHTASWKWGDGNTTTGTVTESNGSGSVSNSHTYTVTGVYTITLTVTDKDGGVGTSTYQYVAIYDSSTSFAGGRSFDNPSGATPNTSGKISFGISSKYSNSNTLTGSVKMNFKVANLNFASTSLQSLATSNGKAYLKGSGTVNGSGNYTFLATGSDGSVTGGQDLIRFQIKDASNNVVYDSQPGAADTADPTTPVATGNIRVH